MTAIYAPWMVEFLLEVIGAFVNLKRSKFLSAFFAVTALMDAITFWVFQSFNRNVYSWATWTRHGIRNLMLIWLACLICGMFVSERKKATISTAFLSIAAAALITAFSANGDALKDKLLDGEIATTMILLAFVSVGWISRRESLNQTWKWIALGFMILVGSDLAFTILWTFWAGARHWYPLGQIAAYSVWAFGPILPARLREFRGNLGHRIAEAQKASVM